MEFNFWGYAYSAGLLLCYVVCSCVLILFNKYLVHRDRFPHAMVLTTFHMFSCILFTNLLYFIRPSMLPGMERAKGNYIRILKWFFPIGILFAILVYCSNVVYLYCSVAFLQFMKEANVVLVFLFSCIAGLQYLNRQRLVVIAWVVVASSFAISGESHFRFVGFILQAVSQIAECMRIVMAEIVLTGADLKLDPLTYTRFVAPVCLIALIIGDACTWNDKIVPDFHKWWGYIILNAVIAFVLNVLIALVIQNVSGVGFILTGLVKDILLVVISSIFYNTKILGQQWVCFFFTVSGVFFWSFMKSKPDHPVVKLFEKMLLVPQVAPPKQKIDQA